MKFFLITFIFVFFGVVCSSQVLPLKGIYPPLPYQTSFNNSYDSVWSAIINILTEQGYAAHIADKTDGLIVSDRFNIKWTYEKKGKLSDTSALIVVPMYYNKANNTVKPEPMFFAIIVAEFNITVKQIGGTISVAFNITNVQRAVYDIKDGNTKYVPYTNYKSTGVFENKLVEYLNR